MNNKYRIFVSMPMHGVTESEMRNTLCQLKQIIEDLKHNKPSTREGSNVRGLHEALNMYDEYELVCTCDWPELPKDILSNANEPRLKYLARAINILADCDSAVFCPGWTMAAGCNVEYAACKLYYIPTFQIDKTKDKLMNLKG